MYKSEVDILNAGPNMNVYLRYLDNRLLFTVLGYILSFWHHCILSNFTHVIWSDMYGIFNSQFHHQLQIDTTGETQTNSFVLQGACLAKWINHPYIFYLQNSSWPLVIPMDVSQKSSIDNCIQGLASQQKITVDILVSNAGVSLRGTVLDTDIEVHRKMMEINYFGPVNLVKGKYNFKDFTFY